MAITLWTGQPGAGKTSAMVDFLSKLSGDRPVYVHFDPDAKRRPDQVLLSESLKIPHTPCNVNEWHRDIPDGSIVVVDEVQDVWRPRGSTAKVPDAVAALETHRHGGIDFFLTTQAPRLLDANVRGLVARHVHIRDTGWLGRHAYEWPECNDGLNWKTCPVKKKFKLSKKAFDLYHSASSHHQTVRATPVIFYVAMLLVLLLGVLVFMSYRVVSSKVSPVEPVVTVEPVVASRNSLQRNEASHDGPRLIDDRVDWIPRVSNKPESAPAYDHLRQVKAMPTVTAGYCQGDFCRCYTNQGTDPGLSLRECREFVAHPPWDPYREVVQSSNGRGESSARSAPVAPLAAGVM